MDSVLRADPQAPRGARRQGLKGGGVCQCRGGSEGGGGSAFAKASADKKGKGRKRETAKGAKGHEGFWGHGLHSDVVSLTTDFTD